MFWLAFRSSGLWPAGPHSKKSVEAPDEKGNLQMRAETLEALSPAQLREWRERMTPVVRELIGSLPTDQTVDLVAECARPLCLTLAGMVTGVDPQDAERLRQVAEPVCASAPNHTTRVCVQVRSLPMLSFMVAFTPGLRRCATLGLLRSRIRCRACWRMRGMRCCRIRGSGGCCTSSPG